MYKQDLRTPGDIILQSLLIACVKLCESGSVVPANIALDGDIAVSEKYYSELQEFTNSLSDLFLRQKNERSCIG
jgi:hypothetical protein